MHRKGRNPLKVISSIITFILYSALILIIVVFVSGYALDSFYDKRTASPSDNDSVSLPSGEKVENGTSQSISPTYLSIASNQWETDLYNSTKTTMSNTIISNPDDYATWIQMPRSVIDANKAMDMNELVRVWQYAIYDDPKLSIYATGGDSSFIHSNGTSYALDTSATTQEGAQLIKEKADSAVNKANEIAEQAWSDSNGDTTAYIQNLYFWLSSNDLYYSKPTSIHYNDLYGAVLEGKTQCYGFSNAMKYMCDLHGIPNFIASGKIPSGTAHAWNVIWSGEKWLVCDCTNGTSKYHGYMEGMTLEQIQQNQRYSSMLFASCLMTQDEFLKDVTMDDDSYKVEKAYEQNLKQAQWPNQSSNSNGSGANSTDSMNGVTNSDNGNSSSGVIGNDKIKDIQEIISNVIDTIATPLKKSLHGMSTTMSFMNVPSQ